MVTTTADANYCGPVLPGYVDFREGEKPLGVPRDSGVANSIIGGRLFIYSCSAQLIHFEIDFFHGL